jgi:uracil-DNA glycosylase family 4
MEDIYTEIENFFQVQKELYDNKILLNEQITDVNQLPAYDESEQGHNLDQLKGQDKLTAYYHQIKDCKKCILSGARTNFVFGAGNPRAEIVFIGEAPGREEDLKAIPFVGKAGQLLTLMLSSIGVKREDVYIANVLKCRPPNNRDPLPDEIEQCEPYLIHQIDLISPKLIVALGRFAAASLLRTDATLGELREKEYHYNNIPLIVTFHPSALLRNPQWKKQAWDDLKKIKKFMVKN